MTNKIKFALVVILLFICSITLSSCSSYKALGLYRSVTKDGYEIRFDLLEGRIENKLLKTNVDTVLLYNCKLESGEVNIYFKTPLETEPVLMCNLKAGDEISNTFGYVTAGHRATIIIETVSKAKGEFSFSYSYQPN